MALIPNFPNVGPVGQFGVLDAGADNTNAGANVGLDNSLWVGGYVMLSILAELRVHSVLLYGNGVPEGTSLAQLRADAIADMGPLYQANATAPIPSS